MQVAINNVVAAFYIPLLPTFRRLFRLNLKCVGQFLNRAVVDFCEMEHERAIRCELGHPTFPLSVHYWVKVCSPKSRNNPTFPLLSLEEVGSGMGLVEWKWVKSSKTTRGSTCRKT